MSDMTKDFFADQSYGKIALKKFGKVSENFRLFYAGWLGKGMERDVMEVKGAEFRKALTGPNRGKLSIKVQGTERTTFVTAEQMDKPAK
jgi:hypothetical protein